MDNQHLKIIGSVEWCTFSDLQIPIIRARIDSGAKTSSIQATDIKIVHIEDEDWVVFSVNPIQHNDSIKVRCKAKLVDKRSIKGSFGISEERLIIRSPITIGETTFDIELSLANRNTMEYRMLLGREALAGQYLINPAEKHLQRKCTKRKAIALYDDDNLLTKTPPKSAQ